MKKITNLIIVDASSSMMSKSEEVISGLSDLIKEIRKDMKKHKGKMEFHTIITQFSYPQLFKVILNASNRDFLKKDLAKNYEANGNTALFDAIKTSFQMVPQDSFGVFVNILTDGEENSSRDVRKEDVTKLFAEANKKKWGITFMGTTQEAIENAVSWGVSTSNTVLYSDTKAGTMQVNSMRSASKTMYMANVASAVTMDEIDNENLIKKK